jgi:hypothetical protein
MAMNRRAAGACAAVLLAIIPAAGAGQVGSGQPAQTRDRLQDRMSELVSAPMAVVERDGLPAGKAAFERLLAAARARQGARSVEAADLLESFGVGLYTLGFEREDRQIREASLSYLQAAIPAYRAAFGDAHPEVAAALNSYADAQLALHEDDPPQSAQAAYEEAYRIRLAALGPTNIETLASLRYLARLSGHPSITRGDRARIDAAARLFRQLIAQSPNDQRLGRDSAPYAHSAFARMYAENGLADEAREQLRIAAEMAGSLDEMDRCFFLVSEVAAVEEILARKAPEAPDTSLHRPRGLVDCFTS